MSENPKLFKKHGISQNAMTQAILKNKMTTGQFDKGIKRISEKAFKEGFKPSEIAEFKKQHESRLKKAQDDARGTLKKRPEMSEYRKKTKGKPSDTGSEYRSGGRVNLRGGGISQRGLGRAFKKGGKV